MKRHSAARLLIMVRVADPGKNTEQGEVTLFPLEHRRFMLVEGSAAQLREALPDEPFSSLEVKATVLLKQGKKWVASTSRELHTATASDEPEVPEKPRKPHRAPSSSSASEEDSDGAWRAGRGRRRRLLQAAKKKRPGFGGGR